MFRKNGRFCLEGFGGGDTGGILIFFLFLENEGNWKKHKNQVSLESADLFDHLVQLVVI